MPVLRVRYFASLVSRAEISVSMSLRTFAMAVCSVLDDGITIDDFKKLSLDKLYLVEPCAKSDIRLRPKGLLK